MWRWFVCSYIPFERIEDADFIEFYIILHPLAAANSIIPNRRTLRRHIINDLQVHKLEIKARLQRAPGKIHISADIWTARNNKALNGIVAH